MEIIYRNFKITKIYEIIEKLHIKILIKFLKEKRKKNIIPCDVLNSSLHIMPDGKVKPCMFMNEVGNIKTNNLLEIIKSKSYSNSKKQIQKDQCPKCCMNCYSPHSMIQNPIKTIFSAFSSVLLVK